MPTCSGAPLPATMYGGSWTSSPMPRPGRWVERPPDPAAPAEREPARLPRADAPPPRLVVRRGAVRAGADDGEVHGLVPMRAQGVRQVGRDLDLAAALEPHPGDGREPRVRRAAGRSQ